MRRLVSGIDITPQSSYAYPVYGLLLTAHIALIWWLPYFPTQDGPSHIYNLVILQDLLNGGQVWGDFYVSQLRAIPNLGFHIIAYPLLSLFSPATTEKLFISLYIILMAVSVPFFMRTFNKPVFPFSFFVFPVMFNFTLMMGFYSYSVAVPLFLLAFGCCYRTRNNSPFSKFIIYSLTGFAIYYLHLIAFGLFILSLASISLSESDGLKDKLRKLLNLAFIISPLLINLLVYLQINSKDFGGIPFKSAYVAWSDRMVDLMTFSGATLSRWQLGPGYLIFYIFICFFTYGVCNEAKDCHQESGLPFINNNGAKCLLHLTFALVLICLFSPFGMGEGSFFNQRFPWVILLVALPILHAPVRHMSPRFTSSILVFIAMLFFLVNAAVMHQKSSCIEDFLKGLSQDFTKGAFIMTYKNNDDYFRIDVLLHAASYYGISKGVVVLGNYEATRDLFLVRVQEHLAGFSAYRSDLIPCKDH